MGTHFISRSCQLSSQSCNGGSLEAQLSDRPADRPHTQTRPGAPTFSLRPGNVTVCQVRSRHIQHRIVPSDSHRDPTPGRVDHLHHHTTVASCNSPRNQGAQPVGCTTQYRVPEHLSGKPRSSDGSHPNRQADHTDHDDQATQSSSKQGKTPPEVHDGSGDVRPLIIKDLELYLPPTNTHSPTLSSEEPENLTLTQKPPIGAVPTTFAPLPSSSAY